MSRLRKLQTRKAALAKQFDELKAARDAEDRDFTDEEKTTLTRIEAQGKEISAELDDEIRLQEIERSLEVVPDANREAHERAEEKGKPDPAKWNSFGEMLAAVARADAPSRIVDPRLRPAASATGLGESVPSDGGFLVQFDYAKGLIQRTYEIGRILGLVSKIGIGATSNGLKCNAINETSRATGSRFGGLQAYWRDEAATVTASKPTFRQMELNLKSLMVLCYATEELLADTTALENVINVAVPEELRFMLEDAIVNGTGAGTPLGLANSGCLVSVAKETNQPAATIQYENVVNMWARLWSGSQPNAVWLYNQNCTAQLMSMTLIMGTAGYPVFMPPGGISGQPYATIFGRPAFPVEYCATLGTVGDLILGDFSQYLQIDKGGIQTASSMHVRFIYDEMTYRFTYRTDGQPTWNSALTPKNGSSSTLSPFVVLATRA